MVAIVSLGSAFIIHFLLYGPKSESDIESDSTAFSSANDLFERHLLVLC